MADVEKKKALITPRARLSYPYLFNKRPPGGKFQSEPMYECDLIFDAAAQKTPEFQAMKAAASQAATENWKGKIPNTLSSPFKDGADKESDGYGPGTVYITVKSKQKPGLVNQRRDDIEDETELYAGCFVRASVRPYAYPKDGSKVNPGVRFGLNNVQKLAEGPPLGNRTRPVDDFEPVDLPEDSAGEDAAALFG